MMILQSELMTSILLKFYLVSLFITFVESGSTRWLGTWQTTELYVGDTFELNCRLSDPLINVTLWWRTGRSPYKKVVAGNIHQSNQVFKVNHVRYGQAGDYQCRAPGMAQFDIFYLLTSTYGIPKPKPEIKVTGEVKYHKDVKLECTAIGRVKLKWYKSTVNGTQKNWQMLPASRPRYGYSMFRKYRTTTVTYLISKFDRSDDGYYICDLRRNFVPWRASKQVNLTLPPFKKPNFTKFPSYAFADDGQEQLAFQYMIEGSPLVYSLTWFKVYDNGTEVVIENCTQKRCKHLEPPKSVFDGYIQPGRFVFDPISFPRDNTSYRAVVSNFLGSSVRTFRVNVRAAPKIAAKKGEISIIHVYKDSNDSEVVCLVKKANPSKILFSWYIQSGACRGSRCKPNVSSWKMQKVEETTTKRSIYSLKSHKDPLFIMCKADNDYKEVNHTWKTVYVAETKPIQALEKDLIVDEGGNVTMTCKAEQSYFEKVVWLYNDVPIQVNLRLLTSNYTADSAIHYELRINKTNITDTGTYKCSGTFLGKDTTVAAAIYLKVLDVKPPVVSLKERTVKQKSSFTILCNVSGHPKPTIVWKKGDVLLNDIPSVPNLESCSSSISGIYEMSNDDRILVICKAKYQKHMGHFSCLATNIVGHDSARVLINITAAPSISGLKNNTVVELGNFFSIPCVANGNPVPRVWWEKKESGEEFKPLVNATGEILRFEEIKKSDLGTYRCVAENGFGKIQKKIQLGLKGTVIVSAIAGVERHNSKFTIVTGCVCFVVVAIIIIVAVVLYKRKKIYGGFYILTLPPYPDYIRKLDPHTPITQQTNKLPYDAEWEFPRNRLKFSRELGSGAFGKVFLADALGIVAFDPRGSTKRRSTRRRFGGSTKRNHYVNNNKMTKVAVKTLKEDSGETEYKDLLSELKILIHVGEHKNIVNLLGACTKGRESELWVIIEFCSNGNLLQFLRNRRDIYETEWKGVSKDPNVQLTMTDLVIAAYQIARGMEFLASRMCIHRDLATRNILVTDNYVLKIADFGLARDVGEESQYVKTSTGLLPVKWMAIEAIIQRLFTEKSDVWSFGIVLWELFTLGGTPYPNISPNQVAEFLARGLRMDPPHACPDEISTLMVKCWLENREHRPTFKELVEILDKIIELHTSSEGGCGYLEVQGEVMNEYLSPTEVKSPEMDPFECNSPLPPIPSPGVNERDSLLLKDQNARGKKFNFDKAGRNKAARQDSELEKIKQDGKPEIQKTPDVQCRNGNEFDGYIDTSLTGKEKAKLERDFEKDRDSSEESRPIGDYAYWKKSLV